MKIIRALLVTALLLTLSVTTQASTHQGTVSAVDTNTVTSYCTWVDGYFRRDGTYVTGHLRCG